MAIPTVQAVGSASAGTGPITVTLPTHAADDILLVALETNQTTGPAAPSGWSLLADYAQGSNVTHVMVFWTRATSSSTTNPTFADPGNHQIGAALVIRGCITTGNPWDYTPSGEGQSGTTTFATTSQTTTVNDCLVFGVISDNTDTASDQMSGEANANLSSFTKQGAFYTTQGNGGGVIVYTGGLATAGSTGSFSGNIATTSAWAGVTFALKPATAAAVEGTAAATIAVTATASGVPTTTGTAAATISTTATATGTPNVVAAAASSVAVTATASGTSTAPPVTGTAAATIATTATAAGTPTTLGTAATTITVTATANGTPTVTATAAATVGVTATAAGTPTAIGSAAATIATTATATGTANVVGQAAATIATTATASGTTAGVVNGTAAATLAVTATAVGVRGRNGQATAAIPTTATATGTPTTLGTSAATVGVTATAVGVRGGNGTAAATVTVTATAPGTPNVVGAGATTITVTATATGTAAIPTEPLGPVAGGPDAPHWVGAAATAGWGGTANGDRWSGGPGFQDIGGGA